MDSTLQSNDNTHVDFLWLLNFIANRYWAFPEKNLKSTVEDINENFQLGRMKVVGIPGGMSKFEGKRVFPKRLMQNKVENSRGVMIKLTGNREGQLLTDKVFSKCVNI